MTRASHKSKSEIEKMEENNANEDSIDDIEIKEEPLEDPLA